MKTYAIQFSVSIHDKATSYPEVKPVDIEIRENLPANVDPHRHVRARIAEELSRAFGPCVCIDNKDENAIEADPLAA